MIKFMAALLAVLTMHAAETPGQFARGGKIEIQTEYVEEIWTESVRLGLDPYHMLGVGWHESRILPDYKGPICGPMQVHTHHIRHYKKGVRLENRKRYTCREANDPQYAFKAFLDGLQQFRDGAPTFCRWKCGAKQRRSKKCMAQTKAWYKRDPDWVLCCYNAGTTCYSQNYSRITRMYGNKIEELAHMYEEEIRDVEFIDPKIYVTDRLKSGEPFPVSLP